MVLRKFMANIFLLVKGVCLLASACQLSAAVGVGPWAPLFRNESLFSREYVRSLPSVVGHGWGSQSAVAVLRLSAVGSGAFPTDQLSAAVSMLRAIS